MKIHKAIFPALLVGLLTAPLAAKQTCKERLQSAKGLTSYSTWMAMQLDYHQKNGDGTQQEADALKDRWLDGKKQGYAQIKEIISDCERQAKQTDNPAEAARLLAVVFNAKLSERGTNRRHINADAIAAISSVDRHDETDAVMPFLVREGLNTWREDTREAIRLMQRAIDLAERHHGKNSPVRADILTNFAFLYSPVEVTTGVRKPHADAKRAEALYSEALAIYKQYPEAMATEEYSGLVIVAVQFYRETGNEQRANELDSRYSQVKAVLDEKRQN